MNNSEMKPIHSKAHSLPCTCSSVVTDSRGCFLWIRKPDTPDKVITFNSISAAFAYGERCIINDDAVAMIPGTDGYEDQTVWSFDNGLDYWAKVDWYWSLCCIFADVSANVTPASGVWPIMRSRTALISIGLGHDLTEEQRMGCSNYGYTLNSYDTLDDVPPLLWVSPFLG